MPSVAIEETTAGQQELVAAPGAGKRILVGEYLFVTDTDITIKFQSASTDITGSMNPGANGGASFAGSRAFECAENEALNINLSGNAAVGGHLWYEIHNVFS